MPAHLRDINVPACGVCGKRATKELRNGQNALIGTYCGRCGPPALARFKGSVGERP